MKVMENDIQTSNYVQPTVSVAAAKEMEHNVVVCYRYETSDGDAEMGSIVCSFEGDTDYEDLKGGLMKTLQDGCKEEITKLSIINIFEMPNYIVV